MHMHQDYLITGVGIKMQGESGLTMEPLDLDGLYDGIMSLMA